ncbi:MAG TPA: hypothetical protein VMZ53_18065 [Kofleriaceae bacterium]|nr:hypothetical protein [Kofleriaceae bacterium]
MSSSGDPPKKDPPSTAPAAPADDREIGSVDELYGFAPDPFMDSYEEPAPPAAPTAEPIAVTEPVIATVTAEPLAASPTDVAPAAVEPVDEPLLPTTTDDNALREAVGIPTPKKRTTAKMDAVGDDEPKDKKVKYVDPDASLWSRKLLTLIAVGVLAIISIAVLVILGSVNSRRYEFTCSSDRVGAEQGRSFPPWGTEQMTGPEWKPIALPPNAECTPRDTENKSELEGWYLQALVDRATTTLTTPNLVEQITAAPAGKGGNALDIVAAQLQQALLLSRSADHRDQRKEVERLMGDVQYWRASLRLRDASAALLDASKQFETAAQQRPRHVTDAAAWSQYVKKLADDLRAGPNGAPAVQTFPPTPTATPPTGDRPSAPAGVALPVETPPSQHDETPPPTPDAGVPTGGVLL